jgi:hypothetical protein
MIVTQPSKSGDFTQNLVPTTAIPQLKRNGDPVIQNLSNVEMIPETRRMSHEAHVGSSYRRPRDHKSNPYAVATRASCGLSWPHSWQVWVTSSAVEQFPYPRIAHCFTSHTLASSTEANACQTTTKHLVS